jgi:hypothetical protein
MGERDPSLFLLNVDCALVMGMLESPPESGRMADMRFGILE